MEVWTAVIATVLVFLLLWKLSSKSRLPPGPWGLPIFGYLLFLSEKPYLDLQRLGKKYGNVFSIFLGSYHIVVINDFQTCKEVFARDALMGRPPEFSFELNEWTKRTGAFLGVPFREQRRFTLQSLRDLGFGKTKMEVHIQEEIMELLTHFEKKEGKPFAIRAITASSMSNNIASLVFGKRFEYNDPIRKMLSDSVTEAARSAKQVSWRLYFPWWKNILESLGIGIHDLQSKLNKELRDYIRQEIEEHEKTLNPGDIRDYIDRYLLEMQKRKGDETFHKDVLQDLVFNFFGAGSETVRLSIEWLLINMAHHQDAQRRIQSEIDEIIGHNRLPIWTDHNCMPYTQAFIMEMQRWKTLVPLNLMRYTLSDIEVNSYFIPKNTHIMANLWAIHHDKECWGEDADEFRPERFLTEDHKTLKKLDHYIPFSIGKRSCPGEPLANIEIFLYFTSILQKFNIRFPDGKFADFDTELGITLSPKEQEIIMTKRN